MQLPLAYETGTRLVLSQPKDFFAYINERNINEHSKSFIGQKYHASLKTSTPIQNLSDIGKYAWQS